MKSASIPLYMLLFPAVVHLGQGGQPAYHMGLGSVHLRLPGEFPANSNVIH